MAASGSLLTGIGTLISATASAGSAIASATAGSPRPYYSLDEQEVYQQRLMNYQSQVNDRSQIAAEKRALQYSDPAFIKQRALAAGVNPSSLLGSTAANAVGSSVSIPGAPANNFADSTGARVSHSLEHVADSALGVARFTQELEAYRDQREARKSQLEALRADIEEKQLRNRLLKLDISKGLFDEGARLARWNEEQRSWQRADKAFNREMEEGAYRMMMDAKRYNLDVRKQDFAEMSSNRDYRFRVMDSDRNYRLRVNEDYRAEKLAQIQFAMNNFDLSQRQWQQEFFEKFGYYPPKNMTPAALVKDAIAGFTNEPIVKAAGKTFRPYGEFVAWVARGFRSRESWMRRQNRKHGSDDRRFAD